MAVASDRTLIEPCIRNGRIVVPQHCWTDRSHSSELTKLPYIVLSDIIDFGPLLRFYRGKLRIEKVQSVIDRLTFNLTARSTFFASSTDVFFCAPPISLAKKFDFKQRNTRAPPEIVRAVAKTFGVHDNRGYVERRYEACLHPAVVNVTFLMLHNPQKRYMANQLATPMTVTDKTMDLFRAVGAQQRVDLSSGKFAVFYWRTAYCTDTDLCLRRLLAARERVLSGWAAEGTTPLPILLSSDLSLLPPKTVHLQKRPHQKARVIASVSSWDPTPIPSNASRMAAAGAAFLKIERLAQAPDLSPEMHERMTSDSVFYALFDLIAAERAEQLYLCTSTAKVCQACSPHYSMYLAEVMRRRITHNRATCVDWTCSYNRQGQQYPNASEYWRISQQVSPRLVQLRRTELVDGFDPDSRRAEVI
jgi:hypothetical protein